MTYGIWEAFSSFQPVTHSLRSAETSYSKALWDEMFAYLHSMIWYRGSKVRKDQSHTTDFFFIFISFYRVFQKVIFYWSILIWHFSSQEIPSA